MLQSYGKNVLEGDSVEVARKKVEGEIRRLPTASWEWENKGMGNELGDLRVFQILPGQLSFFFVFRAFEAGRLMCGCG